MKTFAALPDLLKHNPQFLKYFPLHFYNNQMDLPPLKCTIDYSMALSDRTPNLIKAIDMLLQKLFSPARLSFIELSYLIHFVSDLYQPLHGIAKYAIYTVYYISLSDRISKRGA